MPSLKHKKKQNPLPGLVFLLLILCTVSACRPQNQQGLIFASMRSGNWELYHWSQDKSMAVNISRYPASERFPDLHPNGKSLVFASDREGSFNLYQMDLSGQNSQLLVRSPFPDTSPRWSPNGKELLFVSERHERNENIYLWKHQDSKTEPTEPQRLTDDPSPDYDPAWFPDGHRIVFVSQRKGPSEFFVRSLKAAEQVTQLTQDGREKRHPEVSANGKTLVYAVRDEKGWGLELLTLATGERQPLIQGQKWLGHPHWLSAKEVIFTLYEDGLYLIERINLNGERQRLELGQGDAREMAWLG